ncbi:MAG: membrane protein insertase YidC [Bacteroidales bacterium]|nr:membrane protein insertase YidC [Bacteroidales bacterium]
MDKNSIIGIVLIAGIFFIWSIFSKPEKKNLPEKAKQEQIDSSAFEAREMTTAEGQTSNAGPVAATEQASQTGSGSVTSPVDSIAYKSVVLENDMIKVLLSEKGGRPLYVMLQKYKTHEGKPLYLFDENSEFGFNISLRDQNYSYPFTQNLFFKTELDDKAVIRADQKQQSVSLKYFPDSTAERYIEYAYTLKPGKYQLDLKVNFHQMGNVTDGKNTIPMTWMIRSPQQEKGRDNELIYTSIYYRFQDDDVEHFKPRKKKDENESHQTPIEWIAYKDQFFSAVVMPQQPFASADMQSKMEPENSKYLKKFTSKVTLPYVAGQDNTLNLNFYFGPNKYRLLKSEYGDKKLHNLVEMGSNIVKWINQGIIINLFDLLNRFISNYGIIILVMTIIIKLFLLPLTFKSYMSTAKMKVLKPQIDEINAKIPKEKAMERQQATMSLYKKVGVSPLGGCLPMLLQMPILFAMFRFFPTSIELRQEAFLWAKDLSTYDAIVEWSGNIPLISSTFGNHLSLFTLLMTVSTILSMKFNNQTNANQTMPGMQTMMYIMPVVFMFVLNKFSAGLTYYYFLANIITIGQNFLFKAFVNEEELLRKLETKKSKPKKKSKFQQRIETLQRQQQQNYKPKKK